MLSLSKASISSASPRPDFDRILALSRMTSAIAQRSPVSREIEIASLTARSAASLRPAAAWASPSRATKIGSQRRAPVLRQAARPARICSTPLSGSSWDIAQPCKIWPPAPQNGRPCSLQSETTVCV